MEALIKIEALIDLLLKFIVSSKTICKDIQATVLEISSEDFSEENLLYYYDKIPSEDKYLVYACLAKILNLKEYLLYKDIEKIAKSWDEIKVGPEPFHVHYVMNGDKVDTYTKNNFSGKLGRCLHSIIGEDVADTAYFEYEKINDLLEKIAGDRKTAGNIKQPALEPFMAMKRTGNGKTFCDVPTQIAELIYDKWKELYKDSNDDNFLDLFEMTYTENVDGKDQKVTKKDIGKFFQAFKIGIDCSGYANQVYTQWMFDHGKKDIKEMIETTGPDTDRKPYVYKKGDLCRDNCMAIREEEYAKVKYSTWHVNYCFVNPKAKTPSTHKYKKKNSETGEVEEITEHPTHPKKDKKYTRKGPQNYKESGKSTSDAAEKVVMSKLKAGDLICFEHNYHKIISHFVIVEKTGINEQGQWYFCVTESTTDPRRRWKNPENKDPKWDGVRHDEGYYTSIKDYINTRQSGYEFFWFCRPKAIVDYYDNNTIIEYKENES